MNGFSASVSAVDENKQVSNVLNKPEPTFPTSVELLRSVNTEIVTCADILIGKRVLLAEDNTINQKLAKRILLGWKMVVHVAKDGAVL